MFDFFGSRELDNQYDRLVNQARVNYAGDESFKMLLINKINSLRVLEDEYPDLPSIEHAFDILDAVSKKDFRNLNNQIIALRKAASVDTMNINLAKSIISLILLPILIPILFIQSMIAIMVAYHYMIIAEIALLSMAIALTLVLLNPIMLLVTVPATLLFAHILSEIVMDNVADEIAHNVNEVFTSLFFDEDRKLALVLNDVADSAKLAQDHIEGSSTMGFFRNLSNGFFKLFSSDNSNQAQDQYRASMY